MSVFEEIRELRQAGRLDAALQIANQALQVDSEDIWVKRAAAWVYYAYLKQNSQPDLFDAFKDNLIRLKALHLPEDEKMIFDSCAWQIGSLVFALQNQKPVDFTKINELFEEIKAFHFTKPSDSYSFLYKAFHKGHEDWSNYLAFADWWNFEYFRPEDFLKEEFNGKKIMAVVEQAYIAYSKKLLEGESTDAFGYHKAINRDKVNSFLPQLDVVIIEHPEYQYPPYFKTKLLLGLGEGDEALTSFLPFAKQKKSEFWVWQLMADIFTDDNEKKLACYCKALSLKTPEVFLVKLRQSFAEFLVTNEMYPEAKTEILQILQVRIRKGWKIPNQVQAWMKESWFGKTSEHKDNKLFYEDHLKLAEEILYQNVPEETIVVEFVNSERKILSFVNNQDRSGYFKYVGLIDKPQIGEILIVRFTKSSKDNFFKALSLKRAPKGTSTGAIKKVKGLLNIHPPNTFGFVGDVYIPAPLIKESNLSHGDWVKGKAILSYNKMKSKWGWKCFKIKLQ